MGPVESTMLVGVSAGRISACAETDNATNGTNRAPRTSTSHRRERPVTARIFGDFSKPTLLYSTRPALHTRPCLRSRQIEHEEASETVHDV